jgi:TDG/mug DNA glycosylase family protein
MPAMSDVRGFPPIAQEYATVLILGSMPGRESLTQQQYYAHPRNAFWPIISALYELTGDNYEDKARELAEKGVALWDVLQTCSRSGSLDSAIDDSTIVTNDFRAFFISHPQIAWVFFNGAKAESVYRKHVVPQLDPCKAGLTLQRLPSTSPAHAGMSLGQKADAWKVLRDKSLE